MKKAVLSALVVAALAGTATAQVRLELRLVRQMGTPANPGAANPVTDIDSNSSVTGTAGQTFRFELQYRILNLVKDADGDFVDDDGILPSGLSAATINITSSTGTLLRAQLSNFEHSNGTATAIPPNPDATGIGFGGAAGRRGLHAPFRGGLVDSNNNDLPSNGITNVDTNPDPSLFAPGAGNTLLSITPVAISNHNQGNPYIMLNSSSEPDFAGSDQVWWGLYSFNYTAGSANDTISAGAVADAQTGNAFGYFVDGSAVPIGSANAGSASYQIIIPSPGAVALLGLGGLMVARRRRN